MRKIVPILFTSIGGVLGGLYGYLSVLAMLPALIASDIPVPAGFASKYQSYHFYMLLPVIFVVGWWIGKWRAAQIEELGGWRRWVVLFLLGLIVAVLGYAASIALFVLSA